MIYFSICVSIVFWIIFQISGKLMAVLHDHRIFPSTLYCSLWTFLRLWYRVVQSSGTVYSFDVSKLFNEIFKADPIFLCRPLNVIYIFEICPCYPATWIPFRSGPTSDPWSSLINIAIKYRPRNCGKASSAVIRGFLVTRKWGSLIGWEEENLTGQSFEFFLSHGLLLYRYAKYW